MSASRHTLLDYGGSGSEDPPGSTNFDVDFDFESRASIPRPPRRTSVLSSLEQRLSRLSLRSRRDAVEPREDVWGSQGLQLLHNPPEPPVDLIFVHGLRGGSRKTWSFSDSPLDYWPKEWLPRDGKFKHVRIHSFGYNADWGDKRESILNIHDFGKSLLGAVADSPEICHGETSTRLILVGHSLGGLVIKKAYLLAKQDPLYQHVAARFHSIFFLATPHRGADKARTLNNLLAASLLHSPKNYVSELDPRSSALETINDEFRLACPGIGLWSFYETQKTIVGNSSFLVVEKSSAVLGLSEERTLPLDANHRNICKFGKPTSSVYTAIRNALVATIDPIVRAGLMSRLESSRRDMKLLGDFLGVHEKPEDDLKPDEDRAEGTCEWLVDKPSFTQWMEDDYDGPKLFRLAGNPGAGKSTCTSFIVRYLEEANKSCSYFFFCHSDKSKSSISLLLRSIAFQMALSSAKVREGLLKFREEGEMKLDNCDGRTLWRKIFVSLVFKLILDLPCFWVIDGLDECQNYMSLAPLLSKIDERTPLRIFISSRSTPELDKFFHPMSYPTSTEYLDLQQTQADIRRYLEANLQALPVEEDSALKELLNTVLSKSKDCFLWAHLVIRELEQAFSEQQIKEVLNEVPKEMGPLYNRILDGMSKNKRNVELIKAILTWTVCVTRPLKLDELREALVLDIKMTIPRLDRLIESSCGELIYVDKQSRVQLIHPTAKEFLLDQPADAHFAVDRRKGHAQLAITCLRCLTGEEMSTPRHRKRQSAVRVEKPPYLAEYASTSFSAHLKRASPTIDEPLMLLNKFLKANVLTWIEQRAERNNLSHVLQAAIDLKAYLQRRANQKSPLGKEFKNAELWVVDLIRLVMAFGAHLVDFPFAIHFLIPPICPPRSQIFSQFASDARGLEVVGNSARDWHDRLSCIAHRDDLCCAIACLDSRFAVGLSSGTIILYDSSTCREVRRLIHGERVTCLEWATITPLIAAAGRHDISLWNSITGHRLWKVAITSTPLITWFHDDQTILFAATRSNQISSWSVESGAHLETYLWHDRVRPRNTNLPSAAIQRLPTLVQHSAELNVLAIAYRSKALVIWDIDYKSPIGTFDRRGSPTSEAPVSGQYSGQWANSAMAVALAFNPDPRLSLLAIAYQDGELAVIDPMEQRLHVPIIMAEASVLAASPDGQTLATGDAGGTIKLFNFETLELFHHITCPGYDIKALVFSTDSLRFFDIRGPHCNVWEPTALVRKSTNDSTDNSMDDDITRYSSNVSSVEPEHVPEEEDWAQNKTITALVSHHSGDFLFCAREDGSVFGYNARGGDIVQDLFHHDEHIAVSLLVWNPMESLLASTDLSGRFTVRKINIRRSERWDVAQPVIDRRSDHAIHDILIQPNGEHVLLSTSVCDYLWDATGNKVAVYQPDKRSTWLWQNHPKNLNWLLLLGPKEAEIFQWDSLEKLTFPACTLVGMELLHEFELVSAKVINGSGVLALEHLKNNRTSVSRHITMWNTDRLRPATKELLCLTAYSRVPSEILLVIGTYGSLLVFLDHLHWVCSIDLGLREDSSYARHFLIPPEWLNAGRHILCCVTIRGDVAIVRDEDIVVVRNGLTIQNRVSLEQNPP